MVIKSAIVFGMVASITFQTVNYAVEQLLGSRSTPESLTLTITENDATGVDGFQESVYVRYDVSDVVSKAMPSIVSITG